MDVSFVQNKIANLVVQNTNLWPIYKWMLVPEQGEKIHC
jgi:hypothetical protein